MTGGAGFIGSAFVRLILKGLPGFESLEKLTVIDALTYAGNLENLSSVSKDSRLEIKIGNINDRSLLRASIKPSSIVVNFAAESHVDRSIDNANIFVESNIQGALSVYHEALNAKAALVIQVSTDEVYGSTELGQFTELSNLMPNSPYAASKASADLLARSFYRTHYLPIIITRACNNYGPYQHSEKLIPVTILSILKNRRIPIYGSGLNSREWIHVDDHCAGIALAILKGTPGHIYNIGGVTRLTNLQLVRRIISIMGVDESRISFVPDRKGHDMRYALDSSKISNLGFKENISFNKGLSKVIDWYKTSSDAINF